MASAEVTVVIAALESARRSDLLSTRKQSRVQSRKRVDCTSFTMETLSNQKVA